jgi:signal transduction histidine kinase
MKRPLISLPLQLLAFLVLPLIVLLMLVALGGVALHQSAMRDLLIRHNGQVVRGTAASLSEQLEQRRDVLLGLLGSVERGEPAQDVIETSDGWSRAFFDGGVAFYSSGGRLLAASPRVSDWQTLQNLITPDGAQGNDDAEFLLLVEPGQNATQVVVSISARPNGTNRGTQAVGVVSLSELGLSDVLKSLHTSNDAAIYLVATNGQILYHSDPARVGRFLTGTSYSDSRGDVIATVAPVPASGWTLVQEENWKGMLSPLMHYSQAAPLVLVPGLLIAAGAVWFGIRQIVRPLQKLAVRATDLTWGNFTAIEEPVGGIEEIQRLQATLRHMVKGIQSVQAGMHNYIAAITDAQEEERARLARELHDQTAQSLVALDHRQQMLKPYLSDDPAAAELLSETRSMISQIIEDLRRIVRAMRPVYLEELGLVPALKMLTTDLNLDDRITISFEKQGTPRRTAHEHEIALYRVAQEALNNAWQHSGASHIWLSVVFEKEEITISVRDNGRGFVAPRHATDLSGEGHFGIMGMYERATLISAHLQIQSEPGKGTTVNIRAPLTPGSN